MTELLKANHHFPGPYHLSLVTLNDQAVIVTVRALVEEAGRQVPDADWELRHSSAGKYVSHRVRVYVETPEDVLGIYERLSGIPGIVSIM